jgi:hypothetical protein
LESYGTERQADWKQKNKMIWTWNKEREIQEDGKISEYVKVKLSL